MHVSKVCLFLLFWIRIGGRILSLRTANTQVISPHVHHVWGTRAMTVKMAWICLKAHTCDEGSYCIWDITWSHVTKVEKIKTRLGLTDRLQAWRASWRLWSNGPCGGEAWARLGADGRRQRWKASEVKIDEPQGHVMIRSGSYHLCARVSTASSN